MFLIKFNKFTKFYLNLLIILIVATNLSFAYELEFDYNAPPDVFEDIEQRNKLRGYALNLRDDQKWTNGIVPFIIDQNYSASEVSIINSGMKLIEDLTRKNGKDCIKFVPRTTETTFLRIFNGDGCWSYVGKQFTGAQLLSLKKPTFDSPGSCLFIGIVAHELVHALGFHHEHVRPDRDNYVRINWDKISKNVNLNNFNIIRNGLDLGFGYDYYSIMHYQSTAGSIDGSPTIVPLQSGIRLERRSNLSQTDVAEIRKFYECEIGSPETTRIRTSTTTTTPRTNACFSNPCRNGGMCSAMVNGYTCICTFGFTGTNCEQSVTTTTTTRFTTQLPFKDFNAAACQYYKSLNLCDKNAYIGSKTILEACPESCNAGLTTTTAPDLDFNKQVCEQLKSLNLCDKNLFIGNMTIKQACPVTCNSKCFDEFADNCAIWINFCNFLNQLENNPCKKTCSAC